MKKGEIIKVCVCAVTLIMDTEMDFKKIISFILSLSVVFTYVIMPVSATTVQTVKTVNYINEDFEDGDCSDWAFRQNVEGGSSGQKSVTVVEENGNKFLRMSYTGAHLNGDGKVVMLSKKFSNGVFDMPDDGVTVIELKFRTNQMNLRKMLKYNYPKSNEYSGDCYNEFAWNTRSYMLMHNDGRVFYSAKNAPGANFMQGENEVLYSSYSPNVWYRLKMVMDFASSKVYFSIYNDASDTLLAQSGAKNMDAWWFKYHDQNRQYPISDQILEDFTLLFRNETTVNDEQMDIDDFKVYVQKSNVNAEVIPNTDLGMIYLPSTLSLKFDCPVVLLDGAVSVVDENGDIVSHTGSFDETTQVYTADFGTQLPAGNYKFIMNPSYAIPVNASNGIFTSMSIDTEASFEVCDTLPPAVSNAKVEGRVILGQTVNAEYVYTCDAEEGNSTYEWYFADSAGVADDDLNLIEGQNSKELEITETLVGKYIKFAVTPKTTQGLTGAKVFSSFISPELAPVVNNIMLDSSLVFTNTYVSASYEYFDENGDEEAGTEIKWYASQNGTDNWEPIGEGKNCYISGNEYGKYVKYSVVPVNNAPNFNSGILYWSNVAGPIEDVLQTTNKFSNSDLESGVLTPYVKSGDITYKGVEIINENPFGGSYALRLHPRVNNAIDKWWQSVTLEKDKRYLLSAMVRKYSDTSPDTSDFEGYIWDGSADKPFRDSEKITVTSAENWERVTLTLDTNVSGMYNLSFISFNPIDVDMVIDDLYVGELVITDIETLEVEPVTIPKSGTVEIPFANGKVLNQFGKTNGLTTQKVDVTSSASGVKYKNGNLIIDSTATAGIKTVYVSCTPDYPGALQPVFTKQVEVELVAHDDITPKVLSINATGSVVTGNTLTGSYDFYQVNGEEDASDVRWMYSESENGVYYDIPNATSDTYVVESYYADKYIKFAVTPKTTNGLVGKEAVSDFLAAPAAPTAKNLSVSGNFNVGGTVKGNYDFVDVNKDGEGATTFKWYWSDTENGSYTEITGICTDELVLTEALIDKYIKFAVTPVSDAYPNVGDEILSKAYIGPVAPVIKNIVIENKNNILVATYDFYHPHNAKELNSVYEWKVGDMVVSTQSSYVVDFSGTQTVTFSVTPVADSNPSTGIKTSVSMAVTGISSVIVGGGVPVTGGSSVGGGGIASGIASINNMQLPGNETEETPKSDIDGHWGEEYIKNMESKGVMTADKDGRYNPDKLVNRQDMLTYLFKAIGLKKSEYSGMFNDVTDSEFGGMLQTMVDNGTISVDTAFRPGDSISREEMCKILYISLENAGKLQMVEQGLVNELSDFEDISDWAVKYVNAMYGIKMMIGVSEDRFAPKENVTKAQAATMLTRIISLIEEE